MYYPAYGVNSFVCYGHSAENNYLNKYNYNCLGSIQPVFMVYAWNWLENNDISIFHFHKMLLCTHEMFLFVDLAWNKKKHDNIFSFFIVLHFGQWRFRLW